MKSIRLSNSEEYLMNIFWRENDPLTSAQLVKFSAAQNWSGNYIQKLLSLLEEKQFLTMCGVTQEGKHYSRQFIPCFDKEQYIAQLLEDKGVGTASFAKIAMALVKKEGGDKAKEKNDKLIAELEKMVEMFETKNGADASGRKK